MAHAEELYLDVTNLEWCVRLDHVQSGVTQSATLSQLHSDEAMSQPRGIDWHVKLSQHIWQSTNMVFVTVGDKYGAQFMFVFD
jgi:hypothetical protein